MKRKRQDRSNSGVCSLSQMRTGLFRVPCPVLSSRLRRDAESSSAYVMASELRPMASGSLKTLMGLPCRPWAGLGLFGSVAGDGPVT